MPESTDEERNLPESKISRLLRAAMQRFSGEAKGGGVNTELDLHDYDYWKEAFYLLQTGHDEEVDKTGIFKQTDSQFKSMLGMSGYWIGDAAVFFLRERRVDKNGKPYVVCVDEAVDSDVLQAATPEERKEFFKQAITDVPRHLWVGRELQQKAYLTSATFLGMGMLGENTSSVKAILQETITSAKEFDGKLKNDLSIVLSRLSEKDIASLTNYLQASRSLIDLSQAATQHHRFVPGEDSPITIEGEEYTVPAAEFVSPIPEEEERLLQPFYDAVKRGRDQMIRKARHFAVEYLGENSESIQKINPPSWFVTGQNYQGLWSDEILLYLPRPEVVTSLSEVPQFVKDLYSRGIDQRGWYMLRVPKGKAYINNVKILTS